MPCSHRIVCETFNVLQSLKGCATGDTVYSTYLRRLERLTICGCNNKDYTHYAFTTLGAKGSSGPNSTSGYAGTVLESQVSLSNGIQMWSVPVTGCYVIEATGASGANGTYDSFSGPLVWKLGGLGAKITGTFQLSQGVVLNILVGQEGEASSFTFGDMPGGGGGGSYVSLLDNTPLIVAGGGGGGGTGRDNFTDGDPGQAIVNGSQCGGSAGAGGKVCDADTGFLYPHFVGGGGAGLYGNGGGGGIQTTPYSFIHGGDGGTSMKANGGFGGGASALYNGGGGGGYSGGGLSKFMNGGTSGGGGSFNGGTNQRNIAGVNKGDGKVIISLIT
ncbi:leukocyte tyrosine kinase receptor-like [Montipora foliosa]|uniref:leukocyte tyrosine kinase receptor-like n=1 Tax=Montipora foliosa TaxID=591990 RepID=UPI0035F16C0B